MAGEGLPVVFVHGWCLGHRSYKRALKRLVPMGCRVYAPALPGFGGSAPLEVPTGDDLGGYASWLADFLDLVGVERPAVVAGHSLGGAVVARLAHDAPGRVAHLVLLNSVGGVWLRSGDGVVTMADRPLWDWTVHFAYDILTAQRPGVTLRAISEDAVANLARRPGEMWRAAGVARRVDLTPEMAALRRLGVPVTVVSSEGDLVVPRAGFESLCEGFGVQGRLVGGRHSWLLADPGRFAEVMADVVADVVTPAGPGRRPALRDAAGRATPA